jgi:hypothetical protein
MFDTGIRYSSSFKNNEGFRRFYVPVTIGLALIVAYGLLMAADAGVLPAPQGMPRLPKLDPRVIEDAIITAAALYLLLLGLHDLEDIDVDVDFDENADNLEERVLVVGEANFSADSYTMSLATMHPDWDITGTRYGNGSNIQYISGTLNNVTFVENVDARRLESGTVTGYSYYDGIIFNNPHVEKNNDPANASLIQLFIQSARTRLTFNGEIHINITRKFLEKYPLAAGALGLYDTSPATLNSLNTFGASKYFAPYTPHYTEGGSFPPFSVASLKNFVYYR